MTATIYLNRAYFSYFRFQFCLAMKILHTADWHIGKKLHNYELYEDFNLFVDWLQTCLQKNQIDVLLISGDIFDLGNPSAEARKQYYQSLIKLKPFVRQIILTGGNHDSVSMLNAPRDLMQLLDFEVVGGLPKNMEDAIIPIKNQSGEVEIVVAAIPFLRNPDLPTTGIIESNQDRLEILREGIAEVYRQAETVCREKYSDIPALAMGHLFASGVQTSDSERDIQIGNQASVESSAFGNYFKYIALGHIHKPQKVSAQPPVYYSGSPLPLSFSEREDEKRVLILDTSKSWEPESIPVPNQRKLLKITGNLKEIEQKLQELVEHDGLTHLLEIELYETAYQTRFIQEMEEVVSNFEKPGYQIVKHRIQFKKALQTTAEVFEENIGLEELQPQKVFEARLSQEDFEEEQKEELQSAFHELLEQVLAENY